MTIIDRFFGKPKQTVVGVVRHPPKPSSPKVKRKGHTVVLPDTTPILKKRGWKKSLGKNEWTGSYVVHRHTFNGRIHQRGDIMDIYIQHPPSQIRHHPKWPCFSKRKSGWWNLHLHHNPVDHDPSACIQYVERVLSEAMSRN